MFSAKMSSGKIFRPWDVIQQDSTVTTTVKDTDSPRSTPSPIITKDEPTYEEEQPTNHENPQPAVPSMENIYDYCNMNPTNTNMVNPYLSLQPPPGATDFLPGLPTDLLMSQNYALEEYARILTQDHQAKLMNSRKQRPKKYKCPHCDVGFSNNGQLKGHIRIHTGERPFKCDDPNCGKTFTRNEELTRHKRIHSGLRPFSCTQCGKRFGRKDHLKKHSRTHMQARNGVYAVPVMFPLDTWASAASYPYMGSVPVPVSVPLLY